MDKLLMGLQSDPFITTVIIGLVWPIVQAALDRPWWTRGRRVALLAIVALIVTGVVWVAGSYPAPRPLIVSQASGFLGVARSVYQILTGIKISGHSILDWVGAATPGGQALDELTDQSGPAGD